MAEQNPVKWAELTPEQRDRLVAEKVMGWDPNAPCTGRFVPMNPEPDGLYCTGCGAEICWGDRDCHEPARPIAYTQSMGAAWLVWEKMKDVNWGTFCIDLDYVLTRHKRGWDEVTGKRYVTWFEQFLKTLNADAICLAALKACGSKIDMNEKAEE